MDEARKDEIGRRFLLSQELSADECDELDIQEIIFLIHSGRYFKDKGTFPGDHLDERLGLFVKALNEKIKAAETLYVAYEKKTDYPYVDADGRVWMFSKEEYAANAEDYFRQQLVMLEMKKIDQEGIGKTFGSFHLMGLRKILIDNGKYHVEVDRDDIVPPPDFSGTPQIRIPVTNPGLQQVMIRFFQAIYSGHSFEGKQQFLQDLEERMLDEILRAKYLLPMQMAEKDPTAPDEQEVKTLQEGTTIQFAVLGGEEDSTWLPVFTDWLEFEKAYDPSVWSSNIVTYEDVMALSETMAGAVINYRGIPLRLDAQNKQRIEEYKREQSGSQTAQAAQTANLGGPPAYPAQMVGAVKDYMKTQKAINKAYIRLAIKEEQQMSYFMILDVKASDSERDQIFKDIAEAAYPHLNGMKLDMVTMEAWAEEVKNLVPFYEKRRFGL